MSDTPIAPAPAEQVDAPTVREVHIKIRSDYSPTFDDMVLFESMSERTADGRPAFRWRELRDVLNRALVDGCGSRSIFEMETIAGALNQHFGKLANPNG